MNIKLGDKVIIKVLTMFGFAGVEFTIVDILPDKKYALIAQNRLVIGEPIAGGFEWMLSESIDLLKIDVVSGVYYEIA